MLYRIVLEMTRVFVQPGGTIILSTISRTAFAYLLTIAIAGMSLSCLIVPPLLIDHES